MKLIAQASEGLTRRINILADKALLAAFAGGTHQVTANHARAAVRDSEFGSRRRAVPNAWWLVAAGLAAGLLVGVGMHLWNQSGAARSVAAAASPANASVATAPTASPGPPQEAPAAKASPAPEASPAARRPRSRDGRRGARNPVTPPPRPRPRRPVSCSRRQRRPVPDRPLPESSRRSGSLRRKSG